MNSRGAVESESQEQTLSAEEALCISRRITRACLHAGLRPADAEDVAQDIWEWLLRTGHVALAQEIPWLGAVAQNYIRRFWRRSFRRLVRESAAVRGGGRPDFEEPARGLERKEVLDRLTAALPDRERKLLTLIRNGYSLAEAARALKIPRGSLSYCGGRLVDYARREIERRRSTGVTGSPLRDGPRGMGRRCR
jgi:DNA-directed RNA polymerase specialized sigma24 family protein